MFCDSTFRIYPIVHEHKAAFSQTMLLMPGNFTEPAESTQASLVPLITELLLFRPIRAPPPRTPSGTIGAPYIWPYEDYSGLLGPVLIGILSMVPESSYILLTESSHLGKIPKPLTLNLTLNPQCEIRPQVGSSSEGDCAAKGSLGGSG